MIIFDVEQGSAEWLGLRKGIPTASDASKLVTPTGQLSTQCDTFAKVLAMELAGAEIENYKSYWMTRGNDLEGSARDQYEFLRGNVDVVGFTTTDDGYFGYSPDGFVGEDGLVEFKCPKETTFIDILESKSMPKDYIPQAQAGLWVTGRKWCDLVYHFPGVSPIIFRIYRDPVFIAKLKEQAEKCIRIRNDFLRTHFGINPPVNQPPQETSVEF